MLKVGDKVRLVGSDCPADLYMEVLDPDAPHGEVGGPRVKVRMPTGRETTCAASLLTTDPPMEPKDYMRHAWAGLRAEVAGTLDRTQLRGGKGERRSAKLKLVMDQAEADAAWEWGRKARTGQV